MQSAARDPSFENPRGSVKTGPTALATPEKSGAFGLRSALFLGEKEQAAPETIAGGARTLTSERQGLLPHDRLAVDSVRAAGARSAHAFSPSGDGSPDDRLAGGGVRAPGAGGVHAFPPSGEEFPDDRLAAGNVRAAGALGKDAFPPSGEGFLDDRLAADRVRAHGARGAPPFPPVGDESPYDRLAADSVRAHTMHNPGGFPPLGEGFPDDRPAAASVRARGTGVLLTEEHSPHGRTANGAPGTRSARVVMGGGRHKLQAAAAVGNGNGPAAAAAAPASGAGGNVFGDPFGTLTGDVSGIAPKARTSRKARVLRAATWQDQQEGPSSADWAASLAELRTMLSGGTPGAALDPPGGTHLSPLGYSSAWGVTPDGGGSKGGAQLVPSRGRAFMSDPGNRAWMLEKVDKGEPMDFAAIMGVRIPTVPGGKAFGGSFLVMHSFQYLVPYFTAIRVHGTG